MKKKKCMKINFSTHKRLQKQGQFGDTFDSIINRLIDNVEEEN